MVRGQPGRQRQTMVINVPVTQKSDCSVTDVGVPDDKCFDRTNTGQGLNVAEIIFPFVTPMEMTPRSGQPDDGQGKLKKTIIYHLPLAD